MWALHNNYVAKYGFKKHLQTYSYIGCVKQIFCTRNIRRLIFIEVFSAQNTVRLGLRITKFLLFLKVVLKKNFYKLE